MRGFVRKPYESQWKLGIYKVLVIRLASAVGGPAKGTGVKDCIGSTKHQSGLSGGHLHECSRYIYGAKSNPFQPLLPNPKTVPDP